MIRLAGIGLMALHRLGELAPNKGPGPAMCQLTINETSGSLRLYQSKTDTHERVCLSNMSEEVNYLLDSIQSDG